MADINCEVLVVGAGVIGLSTAICLAEAGVSVTVAAAEPPGQTTSVAAGALWGPHLVGDDDRIEPWSATTLLRLAELRAPQLGASPLDGVVRTATGISAVAGTASPPPKHAAASTLTPCAPEEIPDGYDAAWRITAPLIAMPGYLDYLARRLDRAGGAATFPPRFAGLAEARAFAPAARVIVNCTGCGARDFAGDASVVPVRGQVAVVANPGLTEFFVGSGAERWALTYVFPHGDVVLVGGTEQAGAWSREPDPQIAAAIIDAATRVRPQLAGAPVLAHRVGLRPTRPFVRLEAEPFDGITVVHNYGHGGAGVTLSWGCAEEAAQLTREALG